eukprot:Colp12_sorted_trinity150504_noHs@9834
MLEDLEVKVVDRNLGCLEGSVDRLADLPVHQPPQLTGGGQRLASGLLLDAAVLVVASAVLGAEGPLHHVGNHRRIRPRVLNVQANLAILEDDEVDGLVEPAVGAVAVDELLAHEVQGARLLVVARELVLDHNNEDGRLDQVKGRTVGALVKVLLPCLSPLGSSPGSKGGDLSLPVSGGRGAVSILHDPLKLAFDLRGREGGIVGVDMEEGHVVVLAIAQDNDVLGGGGVQVNKSVALLAGNTGCAEHPLVLAHAHGDGTTDEEGLEGLVIELLLEEHHLVNDEGGTGGLVGAFLVVGRVDDVVVAVDHDGGAALEVHILLPPVSDIVGGEPRLEVKVALQTGALVLQEVLSKLANRCILGLINKWVNGAEVAVNGLLQRRNRQAGQRVLETVEHRLRSGEELEQNSPNSNLPASLLRIHVQVAFVTKESTEDISANVRADEEESGTSNCSDGESLSDLGSTLRPPRDILLRLPHDITDRGENGVLVKHKCSCARDKADPVGRLCRPHTVQNSIASVVQRTLDSSSGASEQVGNSTSVNTKQNSVVRVGEEDFRRLDGATCLSHLGKVSLRHTESTAVFLRSLKQDLRISPQTWCKVIELPNF